MSQAWQILLEEGFHTIGLNKIEAKLEPGNMPSRSLLEKSGFYEEGTLRQYERLMVFFWIWPLQPTSH